MIASGLLGATAHAQSTHASASGGEGAAGHDGGRQGPDRHRRAGRFRLCAAQGVARRPPDEPCRPHRIGAEHRRRAGGRTGRYARRVVQPRARPRRRPRGRHRIAARCAHGAARAQPLRRHEAPARRHAGGARRRRHRPAGRGRALLHLRHHHGLHPGGGGASASSRCSSSTGPIRSGRRACAGRCPIRTSDPSPTTSACPCSTA